MSDPAPSEAPVLLEERRGAVACVTLNRPRQLNALDTALRHALSSFWRRFRDDATLSVAIVTGAGDRAFSTGRDLKETAAADAAGGRVGYEESGDYGYPGSFQLGKPVIAAVHGHCLAAGLMLVAGCDIRICSPAASFGNPQAKRGRGTRTPYELSRIGLPRAVVMDMAMTGEPIGAEDALRWGLVSRVLPQAELLPTAWTMAERIAANSPVVVRGLKRASDVGLFDLPANEALKLWEPVTRMMGNTADAVEGARSFAEKREALYGPSGSRD